MALSGKERTEEEKAMPVWGWLQRGYLGPGQKLKFLGTSLGTLNEERPILLLEIYLRKLPNLSPKSLGRWRVFCRMDGGGEGEAQFFSAASTRRRRTRITCTATESGEWNRGNSRPTPLIIPPRPPPS